MTIVSEVFFAVLADAARESGYEIDVDGVRYEDFVDYLQDDVAGNVLGFSRSATLIPIDGGSEERVGTFDARMNYLGRKGLYIVYDGERFSKRIETVRLGVFAYPSIDETVKAGIIVGKPDHQRVVAGEPSVDRVEYHGDTFDEQLQSIYALKELL